MRPMLATAGTAIPTGPQWRHEVKWDGIRAIASVRSGRLHLYSRNENDVTPAYPELTADGLGLHSGVLDGEIVALHQGIPTFGALAERMHVRSAARARSLAAVTPVTYLVFDLLVEDDADLMTWPLLERRERLEQLDRPPRWQVPPLYDDGEVLSRATLEQGLEGVVSKRAGSAYRPGVRSPNWLKFPHRLVRSFVVGGWRPQVDTEEVLGALLVGIPIRSGLSYLGRVGSGLAGAAGAALRPYLLPLATGTNPFDTPVPREDADGTRWVRPQLVVDVQSLGLTLDGRVRQSAYKGLRHDLDPQDLIDQPAMR